MAGLDVTAHNNSALNTATFTNFSLGFVPTPPVNVTINATNVINTVPTDAFGIFMAVWDTWGGSTPTQLKQSGITAMRYPGGGYSDNYHWSSYLMSPFDGQAGNLGYLSGATDMGHFIQLMSNAQAQAVISVDWGSGFLWNSNKTAMAIPSTNGSPQEAAAWVAYCNASTNIYGTTNDVTIGVDALGNNWQTAGYWAMIRAASPLAQNDGYNFLRINHPAPVGIKYWEVGNEPYGNAYYSTGTDGYECDYAVPYPYTTYPRYSNALLSPAAYGQAVKAFSIAMKAVDPTIKVGAYSSTPPGDYSWDYLSGVNNGQHWTPLVLAQCGSNIDFVIVHWYPNFSDNLGTSLLSEVGSIIPVMINGTGPYPHTGTNSGLEDWITNYCPNPGNVQIFVTEFGADNYPYLVNGTNGMPILGPVEALFAADCYSTWLNYPAFANADWLDFDANSFLGSGNGPVFYAIQMLRHLCNPGDAFVKATSDTSNLRVQGVARQDGNLGILLINESMNSSQTVNVTVTNANLNTTGTIYQFGTNNWTISTNEVPATGPSSNSISGVGSTFSVTLPAYTMDVLVIPVLGNTPPVLAAISNDTVNVGQTVAFTASATDSNQPPPTLTFSLLSAPTNATLDPNSGAFSFRPLVSQANTTNPISLEVTDSGTPQLERDTKFHGHRQSADAAAILVGWVEQRTICAAGQRPVRPGLRDSGFHQSDAMERGVHHQLSGHAVQLARHRRDQCSELLSRRRRSAATVIADPLSSAGCFINRTEELRRLRSVSPSSLKPSQIKGHSGDAATPEHPTIAKGCRGGFIRQNAASFISIHLQNETANQRFELPDFGHGTWKN